MAEQKEVEMLLSMTKPRDKNSVLMAVNKINSGIGGVLRCLYRAEPDTLLTATDLSGILGITSARTAAILKKMEESGYIYRRKCVYDARKMHILLTEKGRATAAMLKQHFLDMLSRAIDLVGFDEMINFVNIINRLCDGLTPPELGSILQDA